jgi:hypothetical protein
MIAGLLNLLVIWDAWGGPALAVIDNDNQTIALTPESKLKQKAD